MSILNLLTKHKNAADVINAHFTKKMLESFEQEDSDVPEEFKAFMREQGVDNENLAKMLDVSPRALFDVFDENHLYIQIEGNNNIWYWDVENIIENPICTTRREAELKAVEATFELLDTKLKQNDRLDSGTIGEQVQEEK